MQGGFFKTHTLGYNAAMIMTMPLIYALCAGIIGIFFLIFGIVFFGLKASHRKTQSLLEMTLVKELKENQIQMAERMHLTQRETTQFLHQQFNQGLEKNASTFTDLVKRLTIIDEAQKKISTLSETLSSNIFSLQNVLSNRGARGALGEVQLSGLIQNMMPSSHYALQHTLSNGKRADCILFLPEPTGHIVIDAKFPLDNYQRIVACSNEIEKPKLCQQFRIDIKKHIKDIMEKYIVPNETAPAAVMFLPAESVFSEIHANYPDLVQYSHECSVWLVSPTTLMAILTTARAVLKDDSTRKQVHVIQEHLKYLALDFKRFDKRLQNLTRYIQQANDEATDVHTSAKKITSRFEKIDHLDMAPSREQEIQ